MADEDVDGFVVLKVVDTKIENGHRFYQVRWANSWEPEEHLHGCQELIDTYWEEAHEKDKEQCIATAEDEEPKYELRKRKRKTLEAASDKTLRKSKRSSRKNESDNGNKNDDKSTTAYHSTISEKENDSTDTEIQPKKRKKFQLRIRPVISENDNQSDNDNTNQRTNEVPDIYEDAIEKTMSTTQKMIEDNLPQEKPDAPITKEVSVNVVDVQDLPVEVKTEAVSDTEETELFKRTAKLKACFTIRKYLEGQEVRTASDTDTVCQHSDNDYTAERQSDSDFSFQSIDHGYGPNIGELTPPNLEPNVDDCINMQAKTVHTAGNINRDVIEPTQLALENGVLESISTSSNEDPLSRSTDKILPTPSNVPFRNESFEEMITVKDEPVDITTTAESTPIQQQPTTTDSQVHTAAAATVRNASELAAMLHQAPPTINECADLDFNRCAWHTTADFPLIIPTPFPILSKPLRDRVILDVLYLFCEIAKKRFFSRDNFLTEIHSIITLAVITRIGKLYSRTKSDPVFLNQQAIHLHMIFVQQLSIPHPNPHVTGVALPSKQDIVAMSTYVLNFHWNCMLTDPLMAKHLRMYAIKEMEMRFTRDSASRVIGLRFPSRPLYTQNVLFQSLNSVPQSNRLTHPPLSSIPPYQATNSLQFINQLQTMRQAQPSQNNNNAVLPPQNRISSAISSGQPCLISGVRSLNPSIIQQGTTESNGNFYNRTSSIQSRIPINTITNTTSQISVTSLMNSTPRHPNATYSTSSISSVSNANKNALQGNVALSLLSTATVQSKDKEPLSRVGIGILTNIRSSVSPMPVPPIHTISTSQRLSSVNLISTSSARLPSAIVISNSPRLPSSNLISTGPRPSSVNLISTGPSVNHISTTNSRVTETTIVQNANILSTRISSANVMSTTNSRVTIATQTTIVQSADSSSIPISQGSCSLKPIVIDDEGSSRTVSSHKPPSEHKVTDLTKEHELKVTDLTKEREHTNDRNISTVENVVSATPTRNRQCRKSTIANYTPHPQTPSDKKGLSFVPDQTVPGNVQAFISKHYDAIMHYVSNKRDMIGSQLLVHKNGSIEIKLINGESIRVRYKDIIKFRHERSKKKKKEVSSTSVASAAPIDTENVDNEVLITSLANATTATISNTTTSTTATTVAVTRNTNDNCADNESDLQNATSPQKSSSSEINVNEVIEATLEKIRKQKEELKLANEEATLEQALVSCMKEGELMIDIIGENKNEKQKTPSKQMSNTTIVRSNTATTLPNQNRTPITPVKTPEIPLSPFTTNICSPMASSLVRDLQSLNTDSITNNGQPLNFGFTCGEWSKTTKNSEGLDNKNKTL